jgi:hypothetical protein
MEQKGLIFSFLYIHLVNFFDNFLMCQALRGDIGVDDKSGKSKAQGLSENR